MAAIRGHPILKLVEGFLAQRVKALLPVGAHLHDPGLCQDTQVPRHAGLMDVHALDNVADGTFAGLHRLDDAKAGWISECLEKRDLRIHAYTLSCIYRTVKYRSEAFALSRPSDAVSAALDILGQIERYNAEHCGPGIILKIGAHCGPSIAVTLNENLDYFGQTVNVAARLQSLADAGEICLSEALYSAPGVGALLVGHKVTAFDAPLRGVEGNACVYRVVRG